MAAPASVAPTAAPLQHGGGAASGADVPDTYEPGVEGMIKYHMYYTASRTNVRLHEGAQSSRPVYYAESEVFTRKPFVYLRRGDAKTSPMVSFLKFHNTSRHMIVGKGDVQHDPEHHLVWEKLERDKWLLHRSDYRFTTAEGSATGERVEYCWHKDKTKLNTTIYTCTDPQGKAVATLLSGGAFNWRKGGEMEVLRGLDEGLREMALASGLGIWTMEALSYQSLLRGYGKDDKGEKKE